MSEIFFKLTGSLRLPKRFFILLILLLVLNSAGLFWLLSITRPKNIQHPLFEGVTYSREVRNVPRPLIIHRVKVDLTHPGIRFLVTPGTGKRNGQIEARTTSEFLVEFKLQLAVNGSFFYPFSEFWSPYPHQTGDPVYVLGLSSSRGNIYSRSARKFNTLYISSDNKIHFQVPHSPIDNAIAGGEWLLKQGKVLEPFVHFANRHYPRTALAVDKAGRTLMILVIDGKQSHYSKGVTLTELAHIIQDYGGYTALNMDGGGSSTLVIADQAGNPQLLNSPIHAHIRGQERLVANHLGIYSSRIAH